MFPNILIVDDEPSILQSLSGLLMDEGFEVVTATNGYEALKTIESEAPDLVLLDIWMPGMDGIETLVEIKKHNPTIQVIMITGHGTIETAVNATKYGAYDFIEKPLSIDKVILSINNALNFRRLEEENKYLRKKALEKHSIEGTSRPIQELMQQIAIAAPTDACILITGENGTGKELIARNIHHLSTRAEEALITVNCATIPEEFIESELFGHEKGAFSGAAKKNIGKFELADKGTIFLDQVSDMSLNTQAKILRALQEKNIQRIGGTRTIDVDIRVIAATNKDLDKEIEQGNFREDLFFRLNVIPMEVPPLRMRTEDIPILLTTFLKDCANRYNAPQKSIDPKTLEALNAYSWPGNVRELKNLAERLAIMVKSDVIHIDDLPSPYHPAGAKTAAAPQTDIFATEDFETARKKFESEFIKQKLLENQNDLTQTAKVLGISLIDLKQKIAQLTA